jgi:hypothetical protein
VCAEAAAAHSEYAREHPQPPEFWLNQTKKFGKKLPFYHGIWQFRKKSKIGAKEILTLVHL